MNYLEFSKKIKEKYPQYSNIDDRQLAEKIIEKYPEYSDITFDVEPGKLEGAQDVAAPAAPEREYKYTEQLKPLFEESSQDSDEVLRKAKEYEEQNETWLESTFGKSTVTDFFGDIYRAAVSGYERGDVADESLDLLTGIYGDADIEEFIEVSNKASAIGQSEEMAEFNKEVDEEGLWAFIKKNPLDVLAIAPEIMVQSVAQLVGSEASVATGLGTVGGFTAAGAAGGAAVGGVGAVPGAIAGAAASLPWAYAAASAQLEASLSFSEYIREEIDKRAAAGEDIAFDKEGVGRLMEDDDFIATARAKAAARGVVIGAVDRLTAGVASSVGKKVGTTTLKRLAIDPAIETAGGAGGEALAQVVTEGEIDSKEVFLEALGETPGSAVNITQALIQSARPSTYEINGQKVEKKDIEAAVENLDDATFAATPFKVTNNPDLNKKVEQRKSDIKTRVDNYNSKKEKIQESINADNELDQQRINSIKKEIAETKKSDPTSEKIKELEAEEQSLIDVQKQRQSSFTENEELIKSLETGILSEKLGQSVNFAKKFAGAFGIEVDDTMSTEQIVKKYGAGKTKAQLKNYENAIGFFQDNKIIINREAALQARQVDVGSHELLHGILQSAFRDKNLQEQAALVNQFKQRIGEKNLKILEQETLENGYTAEELAESPDEWLTQFSDLILKGEIKYDQNIFTKLGDMITPILRSFGFKKIKFNTGEDVYNFMREYSKSAKTGELSKAIIKATGGKAEGIGIKLSKAVDRTQLGTSIKSLVPEGTTKTDYDSEVLGTVYLNIIASEKLHPLINNNLARFGVPREQVSAEFYEDVKNQLFERSLQRFNPEKNDDLGGFVINELQRFAIPDIVNQYKNQGRFQTTEQVEAAPAEGRVRPMQIAEETTTEEVIERAEEQEVKTEEQTFREKLGIQKGGRIYNSVVNSVKRTFGTKLPSVVDSGFRKALISEFKRDLMKPIKDFVGKKKDYREFIYNNFDTIMEKIPTREWVQIEAKQDNKIFAEVVRVNASPTQVDNAISEGLYLLPGAARTAGPTIYRKLEPTAGQLWKFLTDNTATVNGARKTALVERIAQELAFDASIEILRDTDALGKMREIAQLNEVETVANDLAEVGKQLERDPSSTRFSKQKTKNYNTLNKVKIEDIIYKADKIAHVIIKTNYEFGEEFIIKLKEVVSKDFFQNDDQERVFASYLKQTITKEADFDALKQEIIKSTETELRKKYEIFIGTEESITKESFVAENENFKEVQGFLQNQLESILESKLDQPLEALKQFVEIYNRLTAHGKTGNNYSMYESNKEFYEKVMQPVLEKRGLTNLVKAEDKSPIMVRPGENDAFSPAKDMVKGQAAGFELFESILFNRNKENLEARENQATKNKKYLKDIVENIKEAYDNKKLTKESLLMLSIMMTDDMKTIAKLAGDLKSVIIPREIYEEAVKENLSAKDFFNKLKKKGSKSSGLVYEHETPATSLMLDILSYVLYGDDNYINTIDSYGVSLVHYTFDDLLTESGLKDSSIEGKRYGKVFDSGKFVEILVDTKQDEGLAEPSANPRAVNFSKKHRSQYENSLAKHRDDLSKQQVAEQVDSIFNWLDTTDIPNQKKKKFEELALFYMYQPGFILPEDGYKIIEAERIASIKGIDPRSYANPTELINEFGDTVKKAYIDPDKVGTLSNKRQIPNISGYTLYDVDNTEKGQDDLADLVESHLGKKTSPWCITAKKDGKPNRAIWDRYGNYKVAVFKNGKIHAIGVGSKAEILSNNKEFAFLQLVEDPMTGESYEIYYNIKKDSLEVENVDTGNKLDRSQFIYFFEEGDIKSQRSYIDIGRSINENGKSEGKVDYWWDKQDKPHKTIPTDTITKFSKAAKRDTKEIDKFSKPKDTKGVDKDAKAKSVNEQKFNSILEETKGVKKEKEYSRVQAKAAQQRKKSRNFFIPPSAEDFIGLIYSFLAPGKVGEEQFKFFKEKLITPLNEASNNIAHARQIIARDYRALLKKYANVRKSLYKNVPGTDFTYDQAIRAYLYEKAGYTVPGISEQEMSLINKFVTSNEDIFGFANDLARITRIEEGFKKPDENWITATLTSEMYDISQNISRKQFLQEWIQNKNEIFSEANMNKIEALYGSKFREALEDMLYRIENGTNRSFGNNRLLNQFNNWLNASVGTIMFLNMRSAVLQTISAINYINWSDNNPAKAAAAFANQKQFWADFSYLFNSPYLKERRSGLQSDINLAELQAAVAGSKNKAKAAINYLLQKGFLPTQFADSFAIASGGASFYRNRVNTYIKQGLSQQEAEAKAFTDFQSLTETSQQSARPDKISQQQAGPLGRLILAFQNTPSQYAREMKKASLDLINGRGDMKTNISKIVYYGAIQNIIFNALQTALFAMMFGDEEDEEDEKRFDVKKERVVNGMIDSVLRGTGITGAIVATVKNVVLEFIEQDEKGYRADNAAVIVEALNISPPIGSKARKIKSALDTYKYNKEYMEAYGFDIDNPAIDASANIISAATNVPVDRALRKIDNLRGALDADNEAWQRVAMTLGWSKWDVGVEDAEREEIKASVKAAKKEAKKAEAKAPQDEETVGTYKIKNRQVKQRTIKRR